MPGEVEPIAGGSKRQAFIQRSLDVLLENRDFEVKRAVYRSAVPHWVDVELLHQLSGDGEGLAVALEDLLELKLAQRDARGYVYYRDEVRELLLGWLRLNTPQDYLEANRIALAYFSQLAGQAQVTERPRLEREALYHQLILDESGGLRQLNEKLLEACYYHQLDTAELLVARAEELRAQLSPNGRRWMKYFLACLDLVNRRYKEAEERLNQLAQEQLDNRLRALVSWKLGQVLVARQQWSQAIRLYKFSLETLPGKDEPTDRARVLLAYGEAYRDLAERSGGHEVGFGERSSRIRRWMLFFQHLPFLMIEWLVQRVSFLPSLYFGTNYQDWIIDRLLYVAKGWMAKAEHLFAIKENQVELSEARLALAGLEHQVGHWSRARQRYARLEMNPVIFTSRYRMAKVHLGQGRADLTEGKLPKAIDELGKAARTFRVFQDPLSEGAASFLLGQAFSSQGKDVQAAEAFLNSAQAYETAGDRQALTRSVWTLEGLARRNPLPEALLDRIQTLLKRIPVRHTITRFPDRLLQLYRSLALLVALPLAYMLVYQVGSDSVILLSFLETLFVSPSNQIEQPLLLILTLLGKLVLPILLAFWIYRGIYSALGVIVVYFLGRQLVLIEQEQPVHLEIDAQAITWFSNRVDGQEARGQKADGPQAVEKVQKLAWTEIYEAVTINYQAISRPIGLISRMLLQGNPEVLAVEGLTIGYNFLCSEISAALARREPALKTSTRTFTFAEWRSTLVVSMLVLAFVGYLFYIGQIEVSGGFSEDTFTLPISTIVEFTVRTLLLVLPAVMLWRVLVFRLRLRHALGKGAAILANSWVLVAALIVSLLAVRWLLYLALTE